MNNTTSNSAFMTPYQDDRIANILKILFANRHFLEMVARTYPLGKYSPIYFLWMPVIYIVLRYKVRKVKSVYELQHNVIYKILKNIIDRSISELNCQGIHHLKDNKNALFIGNHRDIVLDSTLLNFYLTHTNRDTTYSAIGDNLITQDYVRILLRLNKSFVIERGLQGRDMLQHLKQVSAYIWQKIQNQESVWIAQKEGRTKDGIDKTDAALIKMITLNKPKNQDFESYVDSLKIVPYAISYEWNPCDALQAQQLAHGLDKGDNDDVYAMGQGLVAYKGKVMLRLLEPVKSCKNVQEVVADIDQKIRDGYYIHPSNLGAVAILSGDEECSEEIKTAQAELYKRLEKLDKKSADALLDMYAAPVFQKEKYNE